jgi:hypothetical protein
MATEQQLLEGLRRADAAGNAEDAQRFAAAIKVARAQSPNAAALMANVKPPVGPITPGNIDLMHRPDVTNPDGSHSSVLSGSYNFGNGETLIPHIAQDVNRPLTSEEAIARYRTTGENLGTFGTPRAATNAGEFIHKQQEELMRRRAPQTLEPSIMDRLRTNPVIGAPAHTLLRAGQGVEQLLAHGAAAASDLGGMAPNAVSRTLRTLAQRIDDVIRAQNQGYGAAKQRVAAASTNPRLSLALTGTGEDMGNLLNPAGLVGSGITSPVLRGAASASGFAASQPVTDPQSNYWIEKAKQQAMAVPLGTAMGAVAAPPKTKAPSLDELRNIKTAQYKAIEDVPVPVTPEMRSAIHDQYGREAVLKAVKDAEINQRYGLANEMRSLLDPEIRPEAISANAADKISRAFREMGSDAYATPGQKTAGAGWLGRRAKVETALADMPDLKVARRVNAQLEKATKVEEAISLAQDRHVTPGGTADLNQALRREFGKLVGDRDYMASLTQPERDAIKAVANGTFTANVLQRVGKFSPIRNHLSAMVDIGAMIGGQAAHGGMEGALWGIVPAAVGEGARLGGIAATSRNAALASVIMRRNAMLSAPQPSIPGPAPNVPVGDLPFSLILQALLRPQRTQ